MAFNGNGTSGRSGRAHPGYGSSSPQARQLSRREFALGGLGIAALAALGSLAFVPAEPLVRPPGGQDERALMAACVRCERCYEACPRHVLRPAHAESGLVGMNMPEMCFDRDFCTFCEDENGGRPLCVEACPTGALRLPPGSTPTDVVLGSAVLNADWCLAYHLAGCRFCYEACPHDAIELDEAMRPRVISERCNGCGACESACVSLKEGSISSGATSRAIVVKPVNAQELATGKAVRA